MGELKCRYTRYQQTYLYLMNYYIEETRDSERYKIFETLGMAATLEFYFICFGVLVKIILLTDHPNSDAIKDLNSHVHHPEISHEELSKEKARTMTGKLLSKAGQSAQSLVQPKPFAVDELGKASIGTKAIEMSQTKPKARKPKTIDSAH